MSTLSNLQIFYPSIPTATLNYFIGEAEEFFIDYTNTNLIPDYLITSMCKERINKMNSEGFTGESVGGSSVSYETDYSPDIYKRLNKYKRIRTISSIED